MCTVCVCLFFTLTDRASTTPSNITVANPVRGLLDRLNILEEHAKKSSSASIKKLKKKGNGQWVYPPLFQTKWGVVK